MPSVRRFDASALRSPQRMANGLLRAEGYFARSGVQVYYDADGTKRREYRPPEEVFDAAALASFEALPVTDDHPPVLVTAENAAKYTRGTTGEKPRRDGNKLAGSVMLFHGPTIKKVEKGKVQLSGGYICDYDPTPGTTPEGEKYDGVQRNIRGNHLAIVDVGRAGPDVRLRMDGDAWTADEDMSEDENSEDSESSDSDDQGEREDDMPKKIRIDGITFEVDDTLAQAFDKQEAAHAAELVAARRERDTERARADQAEGDLKKRADAEDPERFSKAVAARVALETTAKIHLGTATRLDGLSTREVHMKVLEKLEPSENFKDENNDYVRARFDSACKSASRRGLDNARRAMNNAETREDGEHEEQARRGYEQIAANAWKTGANAEKGAQ